MGKCSFLEKPKVTPLIESLSFVFRVTMHIYGFSKEKNLKMFILQCKPRHVTPQIDCLGGMSPILVVSTLMYRVSKDIDGKMFIFQC